jgi:hypothetical protein
MKLFHSTEEVRRRLSRLERLTREELDEVPVHAEFLPPGALYRYFAELLVLLTGDIISLKAALDENRDVIRESDQASRRDMLSLRAALDENRKAIHSFDQASRNLTRWLIGLTVVLVALIFVIAWFTILLWLTR